MDFCEVCENLMSVAAEDGKLQLLCGFCRTTRALDVGGEPFLAYSSSAKDGDRGSMLDGSLLRRDPTLPRVKGLPCPNGKCPSRSKSGAPSAKYTRFSYDGMKYFYMCDYCDAEWFGSAARSVAAPVAEDASG